MNVDEALAISDAPNGHTHNKVVIARLTLAAEVRELRAAVNGSPVCDRCPHVSRQHDAGGCHVPRCRCTLPHGGH